MSIDEFLDRVPTKNYNCFDFVREVWLKMCGEDIAEKMQRLVGDFANRKVVASNFKAYTRLPIPISPCFVVMQRFRFTPHVGIFLDGRILHLHNRGVEFQPIDVAKRYFQTIRYYQ